MRQIIDHDGGIAGHFNAPVTDGAEIMVSRVYAGEDDASWAEGYHTTYSYPAPGRRGNAIYRLPNPWDKVPPGFGGAAQLDGERP